MNISIIRRILYQDPIWSAYALADLQPQFASDCQWAWLETAQAASVVLIYHGLEPPVLVTVGSPEIIAQLLSEVTASKAGLPKEVYLHIREEHHPVVSQWYDNQTDHRVMLRLALAQPSLLIDHHQVNLKRLRSSDIPALHQLYAHGGPFKPDAFTDDQVTDGIFFGLFDEQNQLQAAGGTHILSRPDKVGTIGNVYTRPDCRGRGYAKAITVAITRTLQNQGFTTIILSVDQTNSAACTLYQKLGFEIHCPFVEGVAQRRY